MTLIVIWLLFGVASAMVANAKGRSGAGFFVLGVLLGPIGLLGAAVASKDSSRNVRAGLQSGQMRLCPFCAEAIKSVAIICPHCRQDVPPPPKRDLFGREIR
jgi:hypothetical protein